MDFDFHGTYEEFDKVFPSDRRHNGTAEVLAAVADLKGMITMQSAELTKLNELTNTLATTVEEVVAADKAEDAAFLSQIDDLKAQLSAAGALTAEVTASLNELTAGVGDANPRLQAVIDALKATGAEPANPLPTPVIPPAESV